MEWKRQKPGAGFRGNENIVTTSITPDDVRAINKPCSASDWDDVFEIPMGDLHQGQHLVAVDLVEPGGAAVWEPGRAVKQYRITGHPEILITIWNTTP